MHPLQGNPTHLRLYVIILLFYLLHYDPHYYYYLIIFTLLLSATNDYSQCPTNLITIFSFLVSLFLFLSLFLFISWKWTLQQSMEDQWEIQQRSGLGTERDADLMRETLLETSPWLLGLTFVVSLLHMLFDFLAFKNDIQFWRKKKSMAGMSVRTLGVNCFFQTVRC